MAKTPTNATEYLKTLLDFAAQQIPSKKHNETPLYILATAGLRLLSEIEQKQILEDLFNDILRDYQFLVDKTHFEVISGQDEGIYSWIAINYVLGRFRNNKIVSSPILQTKSKQRSETVGILDMGGASAQIAFEVSSNTAMSTDDLKEISLGYDDNQDLYKYKIYVTTYLGYGANKILEKYLDLIISNVTSLNSGTIEINDVDCLPRNYEKLIIKNNVTIKAIGDGDFMNCRKQLMTLLYLNRTCLKRPCSFNGVYQPEINYQSQDFYGFSEFWYTMEDILKIGGSYREYSFLNASMKFCRTEWNDIKQLHERKIYKNVDLNRFLLQCFKSAWLYTFLHDGLKFPIDYQRLQSASLVNNNDVQWTLGALIYRTRFFPLRSIKSMKNQLDQENSQGNVRTIFILLSLLFTICLFIFAPKRIRTFLSDRKGTPSNPRYQLLASTVDDV